MEKLFEIVLTAAITLLGGILIFSITKLIEKLMLDPLFELKKIIGQISYCLMFNANKFGHKDVWTKEELNIVSDELRLLASKLHTQILLIHGYWILKLFKLVPSKKRVHFASKALIGLSNGMFGSDFKFIENQKEIIKKNLNV